MSTPRLLRPPNFVIVRSVEGEVAADDAEINLTNYPTTLKFSPAHAARIVLYWHCTGGSVETTDNLDLQVLVWDGLGVEGGRWVLGQRVDAILQDTLAEFKTYGASNICIRVADIVCAAGEDLEIWAALSSPEA